MGEERRLDLGSGRRRPEWGQPAEDPWGAEPALAGAVRYERTHQPVRHLWVEAFGRGHRPAGHPPQWGHARHSRRPIHQDRATTALALRTAPILDRSDSEALTEGLEQRSALSGYLDRVAVEGEVDAQLS
jgi:hypothetical protein